MPFTIPIKASQTDKDELTALLSNLKTETSEVSIKTTENSGLAMDPATVSLIFGTVNVVVPALITAIATIWVAHIQNKKKANKSQNKTNILNPNIIIETDDENIKITIDASNIKASVQRVGLPKTIEQITRIRLEGKTDYA